MRVVSLIDTVIDELIPVESVKEHTNAFACTSSVTCYPVFYPVTLLTPSPARHLQQSGNVFRVGIFLDFVRRSGTTCARAEGALGALTARAEGPHGAHVRGARRNRIDRPSRVFYRSFAGRTFVKDPFAFFGPVATRVK